MGFTSHTTICYPICYPYFTRIATDNIGQQKTIDNKKAPNFKGLNTVSDYMEL